MSVHFKFDHERTLAALSFFASKNIPDLTKWRICKLLFLADKLHLTRYARPITGDTYYAMEWGPVPSDTLNALNNENPLAVQIAETIVQVPDHYPKYALRPGKEVLRDSLSESDIEVLSEVVSQYGNLPFTKLNDIVHNDRAYIQAWRDREGNRALMNFESFFEQKDEVFAEFMENAAVRRTFVNE